MSGNRAVAYMGPGKVEVQTIDYPGFVLRTDLESIQPTWAANARTA